jgi:hypothetical protein
MQDRTGKQFYKCWPHFITLFEVHYLNIWQTDIFTFNSVCLNRFNMLLCMGTEP